MSKVITFSRQFPAYHPKAGQPTHFVEKILTSLNFQSSNIPDNVFNIMDSFGYFCGYIPKFHTIRTGNRWKVGDKFSPRCWGDDVNPKSGRSGPYHSKQIIIAPDIQVQKTWDFEIKNDVFLLNGEGIGLCRLQDIASNDGLHITDFNQWFPAKKNFTGQIICWNEKIEY